MNLENATSKQEKIKAPEAQAEKSEASIEGTGQEISKLAARQQEIATYIQQLQAFAQKSGGWDQTSAQYWHTANAELANCGARLSQLQAEMAGLEGGAASKSVESGEKAPQAADAEEVEAMFSSNGASFNENAALDSFQNFDGAMRTADVLEGGEFADESGESMLSKLDESGMDKLRQYESAMGKQVEKVNVRIKELEGARTFKSGEAGELKRLKSRIGMMKSRLQKFQETMAYAQAIQEYKKNPSTVDNWLAVLKTFKAGERLSNEDQQKHKKMAELYPPIAKRYQDEGLSWYLEKSNKGVVPG